MGDVSPSFLWLSLWLLSWGKKSVSLIFISQLGLSRNQPGQRIQWEGKKLKQGFVKVTALSFLRLKAMERTIS